MDQNALLAMLMQGQMPKQLMMNPAPALAGLPGAGQIAAPTATQAPPPPPLMDASAPHPQQPGMQQPIMPPPVMPQQNGPNPIAQGIADMGTGIGKAIDPKAAGGGGGMGSSSLLQMLLGGLGAGAMGGGGVGGIGGLLGLLK